MSGRLFLLRGRVAAGVDPVEAAKTPNRFDPAAAVRRYAKARALKTGAKQSKARFLAEIDRLIREHGVSLQSLGITSAASLGAAPVEQVAKTLLTVRRMTRGA
jgi:hypothetical protein